MRDKQRPQAVELPTVVFTVGANDRRTELAESAKESVEIRSLMRVDERRRVLSSVVNHRRVCKSESW